MDGPRNEPIMSDELAENVPFQCSKLIADLAEAYGRMWHRLAAQLRDASRPRRDSGELKPLREFRCGTGSDLNMSGPCATSVALHSIRGDADAPRSNLAEECATRGHHSENGQHIAS